MAWFPRDGAILHYHFARLNLCSYIFRGHSAESASSLSTQAREFAELAVSSATAVVELVLERDDLREGLVGMPVYFHGMITFAAVFLIKTTRGNMLLLSSIDAPRLIGLVQRCIQTFQQQSAAKQHMVYHLGRGLEGLLSASRGQIDDLHDPSAFDMNEDLSSAAFMDSLLMMDSFDAYPELFGDGSNPL